MYQEGNVISTEEMLVKLNGVRGRDILVSFDFDTVESEPTVLNRFQFNQIGEWIYLMGDDEDRFKFNRNEIYCIRDGMPEDYIWIDFWGGAKLMWRIDKVLCDRCGRDLWAQNTYRINQRVGYGSRYDGEEVDITVCGKCFDDMYSPILDGGECNE